MLSLSEPANSGPRLLDTAFFLVAVQVRGNLGELGERGVFLATDN